MVRRLIVIRRNASPMPARVRAAASWSVRFGAHGPLLIAALVLALSITLIDVPKAAADDTQPQSPSSKSADEAKREQWRQERLKNPPLSNAYACFAVSYPDTTWHEVLCGKPNLKPYPPKPPKVGAAAGAGSP